MTTQKTLTQAFKAFAKMPSAKNYSALQAAMLAHQAATYL
jgi:hypothetical protein